MELIIRGAFTEQEVDYVPVNKSVEILFEDDFILIANKPAGISTHPNEKGKTDTLMNRLVAYLKQKGEPVYIKHIQRLDKDTTGAVLFAKSALVGTMLDHALTRREIKRTYLAIVHGKLNKQKGTIDAKIGRDRHHPTRRRVSPTGQEAVTHYEVVNYNGEKNISTVMCQLDTGRTHQIRVHLSDLGHPLVGDQLYGGKKDFYRQALHAIQLDFTHPLTLKKMSIRAPFVDDLHIFTKNH